ncbi:hypothetical protein LEN26_014525 [Aphanomyces euteiches]|nr:hypothetical protein LEN26_014525 [Aphanomyces euteiches]KAH9111226.1 hypothetical protein AeMF1_014202 [Aphanomyces euteiches]KAH9186370.1 hypothetical protein AeNC1_011656 [Aphanomyces euteiches]
MAEVAPTPQGSFTVVLGDIRWTNQADGDSVAPSYWAHVDVLSDLTLWWSGDTEYRASTSVISASSNDEDDGLPSFRYSQSSKLFPLSSPSPIPPLCATTVAITLYKGTAHDKTMDELVGAVNISLKPLVVRHESTEFKTFSDELSVQVGVAFDVAFVEAFQGAKALNFVRGAIRRVPQEWKLVPKEGEDAATLAANPEINAAKYTATIVFPSLEAETPPVQLVLGGKLELDASLADVDQAWAVQLTPVDPSALWFLSKTQFEALERWMEDNSSASVSIQRVSSGETWLASSKLSFLDLFVPGTKAYNASAALTQGVAPTRESLEDAVAKAASGDDKKKAQAALNDYENLLTRIAGQAAIYISAGTQLCLEVSLLPDAWISLPPEPTPPPMTLAQLIPPRPRLPPFPPRDALASMHKELRKIISMLMKEYERLFFQPLKSRQGGDRTDDGDANQADEDDEDEDDDEMLTKEDRRQKLIFHLNAQGIYFDFKERLKKALVAVIRERFPALVATALTDKQAAKSEFYAQLYSYLMEEVNVVLHAVFDGNSIDNSSQTEPNFAAIQAKLAQMRLLAWENEVNGQLSKATTVFLDRIALVDAVPELQAHVWFDFALFSLRTQDFHKGGECLRQCIAIDPNHLGAVQAYGALLCQTGDFEAAEIVLKNALGLSPASPHEQVRGHALLALYYTLSRTDSTGNLRLHELLKATKLDPTTAFRSPAAVCIRLAAYCKDLGLYSLAHEALAVVALVLKPKTALDTAQLTSQALVSAAIELHVGHFDAARDACQVALDMDAACADSWYLCGLIASRQGLFDAALESYSHALGHMERLADLYHLPLYLQLGALYMQHQQWGAAKAIFLRACHETSAASAWLGVGVVCIRQEDWEGAEMALAEANVLDRTNADVWGYLSLVCLNVTPGRPKQAEQALEQALRYDLTNATLLRELSNGFVALDKLEMAESLLRRSLLTADSSLTRKTLADVLAAQNCAATALEQYKKALDGCATMTERTALLSKCAELLTTLGRLDEAQEFREIAMHQQQGAEKETLLGMQMQQPRQDVP